MPGARFILRNRMFTPKYWVYALRYLWFRLRNPHIRTSGMVFLGRGAEVMCTRGLGHMELGRWVWVGDGTSIRCHEGFLRVGDKVVFGGRDTVNCYLDVEIGPGCIFADNVYVADFDHRYEDPEVPIRRQGVAKSPVRIGADCWIGEKVTVIRGARVGDGSVVGALTLVRGRFPDGSVIVGNPGRVAKTRGSSGQGPAKPPETD